MGYIGVGKATFMGLILLLLILALIFGGFGLSNDGARVLLIVAVVLLVLALLGGVRTYG